MPAGSSTGLALYALARCSLVTLGFGLTLRPLVGERTSGVSRSLISLSRRLHVIERLRSNPRMSAIPIIVLTATRDQAAVQASHALGANGFITKPDTREDYCSQVRAIVERWVAKNVKLVDS